MTGRDVIYNYRVIRQGAYRNQNERLADKT